MKNTSRNIRTMKQKMHRDTDRAMEDIESLQRDIFEYAVSDVPPEGPDDFATVGLVALKKGSLYRIKDDGADGVFLLESVSKGKVLMFVFVNTVTGCRTTYTSVSIGDLLKGSRRSIKSVTGAEAEKFGKNYWNGHVDKALSAQRKEG